jgi:hypothetical protein
MVRIVPLSWYLIGAVASFGTPAFAAEADGCSHFTWDVTHELAVMKQAASPVAAATKPGSQVPLLEIDKLYELKLSAQSAVSYSASPAKPTLNDSAQGGLVRFRVKKAGLYRISITSGHWIDVVDGDKPVKSKDFQGSRGCARPHKIVEFDLPANKELVLQLSGATDSSVTTAITPVTVVAAP